MVPRFACMITSFLMDPFVLLRERTPNFESVPQSTERRKIKIQNDTISKLCPTLRRFLEGI